MGQILQFKQKVGMRRFFDSDQAYQEYLKAEERVRKEPLGPFLTLRDLWDILFLRG